MTTIKSYTDIKQSKVLAKILPLESADMWFANGIYLIKTSEEPKDIKGVFHCWSLAALLNILDYPQLSKDKLGSDKTGWMVSAYPNDCRYDSCWHDNPIDCCVEMIIKLNKSNLL